VFETGGRDGFRAAVDTTIHNAFCSFTGCRLVGRIHFKLCTIRRAVHNCGCPVYLIWLMPPRVTEENGLACGLLAPLVMSLLACEPSSTSAPFPTPFLFPGTHYPAVVDAETDFRRFKKLLTFYCARQFPLISYNSYC
jgi:hypothetical protein